ncbi:MAG: hypothetical protein JRG80_08190, partial [Deltaproteobacteria bacterium]|nr:hypothetical protein [Deltaproteobacteria bacterium]
MQTRQYADRRPAIPGRLNGLQRQMRELGATAVIAFEGWDAAGKGGAIRRITT